MCGRTLVQVQAQAEGDVCQLPRQLLPRRTQLQIHAVSTAWGGGGAPWGQPPPRGCGLCGVWIKDEDALRLHPN